MRADQEAFAHPLGEPSRRKDNRASSAAPTAASGAKERCHAEGFGGEVVGAGVCAAAGIRVVDVTGDYRVGVYAVYRPKAFPGGSILHRVNTTEIYYMLSGAATLVTGGTMLEPTPAPNGVGVRGSGIEGGVSRRIVPGDVVIIPGHTPHYWSELETNIEYLIFRPDPNNRLTLR